MLVYQRFLVDEGSLQFVVLFLHPFTVFLEFIYFFFLFLELFLEVSDSVFGLVELSYFFLEEEHDLAHFIFLLLETVSHLLELLVLLNVVLEGGHLLLELLDEIGLALVLGREVPVIRAEHSVFFLPAE
jgi:hypothetical protein